MTQLANSNNYIVNGNTRTATIVHNPENCSDPSSCYYLISVFYPYQNGPMKSSFSIGYNVTDYSLATVD